VELYGKARTSDPIFQSAYFSLQAARQAQPEAFSALLPAVGVTGSATRTTGRTSYTDTPAVNRSFNGDQWVLQLTQPLLRAEVFLGYSEARAGVRQAVAQYSAAEQDLVLRLARAYFDVVVAERHVRAIHAQVAALSEQLLAARHSYEGGVASITDVDDTESRTAIAKAQEVAARNDVESARAALESITGESPEALLSLRADAVLPRPVPSELTDWVERATHDNPSVLAATAALQVADTELDRSRAQRLPAIDMVATYGGNYSAGNITDPVNYGTNVKDRSIGVQVTMPIVDGGAIHARVAEARAKRAKAQSDLEGAERQAALDAKQAYAAVLSGVSQVSALETAIAAGRNAVKGNRIGYRLGIRINSDVLNAEQQLYSSMQDLDKARYDTLFAGLKLKAATGELSSADLDAVNALLGGAPDLPVEPGPGGAPNPALAPRTLTNP